ncbi:MAG TPA: hypothetical protein VLB85_04970 [Acidimicrobiia bacterium]|nr:hypothetical protein [Acidimicrobiia bacterium]
MSQTIGTETAQPTAPVQAIRPPTSWYWIAGVIAFVGLVAGLVIGILGYLNALDEYEAFPRLAASGVAEVVVDDPGNLVIYHRGAGSPHLSELGITVTDPSGSSVAVEPYDSVLIFGTGDGQARAVATFDAVSTGSYRMEVAESVPGDLAVGRSWAWVALPAVLGGLGIAGLSILAAAAIGLTTIIRRSSAAARHARASLA